MDLNYIDNLIPWEKETYTILLLNWIQEEKLRLETKAARQKQ